MTTHPLSPLEFCHLGHSLFSAPLAHHVPGRTPLSPAQSPLSLLEPWLLLSLCRCALPKLLTGLPLLGQTPLRDTSREAFVHYPCEIPPLLPSVVENLFFQTMHHHLCYPVCACLVNACLLREDWSSEWACMPSTSRHAWPPRGALSAAGALRGASVHDLIRFSQQPDQVGLSSSQSKNRRQ